MAISVGICFYNKFYRFHTANGFDASWEDAALFGAGENVVVSILVDCTWGGTVYSTISPTLKWSAISLAVFSNEQLLYYKIID